MAEKFIPPTSTVAQRRQEIFEEECEAARKRNQKRLNDAGTLVALDDALGKPPNVAVVKDYVVLRTFEVATLHLTGRVEIKRFLWPPKLFKQAWCPFGQAGKMRHIHEPVAYFGAKGENAIYVYSDDPLYRDRDMKTWVKVDAARMPLAARRFIVVVETATRMLDKQGWILNLKVVKSTSK